MRSTRAAGFVLVAGLALVLVSLWQLEAARRGISITDSLVGQTPVTRYAQPGAEGPVVVIAHGFAGSRQMMQGYALVLAQAGYVAYAFDFLGHGRNPVPMSGDVTSVDGTTRLLIAETQAVIAATRGSGRTALLGHSMATDILIRAAIETPDIGPVVALSAFSQAVTDAVPDDLLLITGAWEGRLRTAALEAVQMVDPNATEGDLVRRDDLRREAFVAPWSDHVSILQSRAGRRAALDWLNESYGRTVTAAVPPTGWWLMGLLAGVVALAYPLSQLLPMRAASAPPLRAGRFLIAAALPAFLAPLVAVALDIKVLPVLVADYLAVHLAIYGGLQLALLRAFGLGWSRFSPLATLGLVIWGLGAFGLSLDRYGANFVPEASRLWIIAALALGAVPFMLADAVLTCGGRAPLWQRVVARLAFLGSLGLAVALDFEGLFFLLIIAPVIVLFYVVFGLMGRWVAQRSGPAAAGLGLGLVLAWALGVSFPLFAVQG